MRKPSAKQISLKTTWSPEDEVEFFDALARQKKDYGKATMLMRRAKAVSPDYPQAAIMLLEECMTQLPAILDYQQTEAAKMLGAISVRIDAIEDGANRLLTYSKHRLSIDDTNPKALFTYMYFIAENHVEAHYQTLIDLVSLIKHDHPREDLPYNNNLASSWNVFCAAAYFADCLGKTSLSKEFLEKAAALQKYAFTTAPEQWRLWLFKKTYHGSRSVAFVVVRPELTMAEMREWAQQNWTAFRPEITCVKTETEERLILIWDDYAVEFVLHDSAKKAGNYISYFKKKNLGKFQTEGARALSWRDAGDFNGIDAINTSIEILDHFRDDPRIAVNIG